MTNPVLAPPAIQQFQVNGVPLVGGLLYTYVAGTTTLQVTYTDSTGATQNTNPIVLNSNGIPQNGSGQTCGIWLNPSLNYKLVLTTPTGTVVWTVDNVSIGYYSAGGAALVGFIQAGVGAVARNLQAKAREIVSVEDFGAVGDGITDDAPAFQAALLNGGAIYVPWRTYRLASGITISGGSFLVGAGINPGNPPVGTNLVFDLSVANCVTLGGSSGNNLSPGISGFNVMRAAGTPPAGSVGVLVQNVYNPIISDVMSYSHQVPWKFSASDYKGIACAPTRIFSAAAYDAHLVMDTWCELRITQSRFGMDGAGDVNCNDFIRVQGGSLVNAAAGPNTLYINNTQFNQGQNQATNFCRFANQTTGAISDIEEWVFNNVHVESCGNMFASDSTWPVIVGLKASNCQFHASAQFFALNAATTLSDVLMSNNLIGGQVTLAPTAQFNDVTFTGNRFFNGASFTGVASSTLTLTGNNMGANLTIAGSFATYSLLGTEFTSGGYVITANGAGMPQWTPNLLINGSSAGITYAGQVGVFQVVGRQCQVQGVITLTSKGSNTGAVSMSGLPIPVNASNWGGGGGSALAYDVNLASLTGPVLMEPAANSSSVNIYQGTATGVSQLTNANLTNTTSLQFSFSYFI